MVASTEVSERILEYLIGRRLDKIAKKMEKEFEKMSKDLNFTPDVLKRHLKPMVQRQIDKRFGS